MDAKQFLYVALLALVVREALEILLVKTGFIENIMIRISSRRDMKRWVKEYHNQTELDYNQFMKEKRTEAISIEYLQAVEILKNSMEKLNELYKKHMKEIEELHG